MPAITITDLNNAELDVDHIAEVANSTDATATDRLGNTKSTLKGAIDTIKSFVPRGAFAGATAYAIKDLYTDTGTTYATVIAHTSTTVAADLAAGKVTIHQGATKEEFAASTGTGLLGTILSYVGSVLRTQKDKNEDVVHLSDLLSVAQRADVKAGTALLGCSAAYQKALDTGRAIKLPAGVIKLETPVTRTSNNINIEGEGESLTSFLFTGTGIAMDFLATDNFLQSGRIRLAGFKVKTTNNDAKGTAYSTYTDQAIRLKHYHGSAIGPVLCEGFLIGYEMDTCYHNDVSALTTVSCYRGLVLSNGSNGNVFHGGVHAASSIDLSGSGINNTLIGVDVEPGSRTNYFGTGNKYLSCRFERISLTIPINPWIDMGSSNIIDDLSMPFNGSSIQADGSFMVKVNGDYNIIRTSSPYVHRNGFYFHLNSNDNHLTLTGTYNDNANTGGAAYIASKQWIIDYGVRNQLTVISDNGTVDTVGDISQTISGNVPNKCPIDIASWTLSGCTAAQPGAGYLGPMGAPVADLLIREFTATGVDPSIDTGLLYTADGVTVYSTDCWVLIPGVDGVSGLTLRSVTNNGGHTIDATSLGKWIRLWQVGMPANADPVRFQLLATGAIGKKFMMALPRVGTGYASGYTPPNSAASTVQLANFISGKYAPVWTASSGGAAIGNGSVTGWYSRSGKQVTATVETTTGSTTAVGTGFYEFTLPSLCRTDKAWNCTGTLYDASTTINYVLGGYVNAATGKVRLFPNGITGIIGAAVPVVPATNDYLTFSISYEEA